MIKNLTGNKAILSLVLFNAYLLNQASVKVSQDNKAQKKGKDRKIGEGCTLHIPDSDGRCQSSAKSAYCIQMLL